MYCIKTLHSREGPSFIRPIAGIMRGPTRGFLLFIEPFCRPVNAPFSDSLIDNAYRIFRILSASEVGACLDVKAFMLSDLLLDGARVDATLARHVVDVCVCACACV